MWPQENEEELVRLKKEKEDYNQKLEEIGKLQTEKKVTWVEGCVGLHL